MPDLLFGNGVYPPPCGSIEILGLAKKLENDPLVSIFCRQNLENTVVTVGIGEEKFSRVLGKILDLLHLRIPARRASPQNLEAQGLTRKILIMLYLAEAN